MKMNKAHKILLAACLVSSVSALLASPARAQNSPGLPMGVLSDDQFHFNQHPQLPFAASAASQKYQSGKPSDLRKKGDLGDPNGCNLKCPTDGSN
jgi:hypothetical protein